MFPENMTETAKRLVEGIFKNPLDGLTRAILSDKLEEDGVKMDDVFPKIWTGPAVNVTTSYGSPWSVECPMRRWLAETETCYECDGKKDVLHPTCYRQPCKTCGAKGKVKGLGIRMASVYPIAKVFPNDKKPLVRTSMNINYYFWVKQTPITDSYHPSQIPDEYDLSMIPDAVFLKMVNGALHRHVIVFDCPEFAFETLSAALVDAIRDALFLPRLITHHHQFQLFRHAKN